MKPRIMSTSLVTAMLASGGALFACGNGNDPTGPSLPTSFQEDGALQATQIPVASSRQHGWDRSSMTFGIDRQGRALLLWQSDIAGSVRFNTLAPSTGWSESSPLAGVSISFGTHLWLDGDGSAVLDTPNQSESERVIERYTPTAGWNVIPNPPNAGGILAVGANQRLVQVTVIAGTNNPPSSGTPPSTLTVSRYDPMAGWSASETLSASSPEATDYGPKDQRAAIAPDGTVLVTWALGFTGTDGKPACCKEMFSRYAPGAGWTQAAVFDDVHENSNTSLVATGDGSFSRLSLYGGATTNVAMWRFANDAWAPPQMSSLPGRPDVAIGADGSALAIGHDPEGQADPAIYFSPASGWKETAPFDAKGKSSSSSPYLVTMDAKGGVIAWSALLGHRQGDVEWTTLPSYYARYTPDKAWSAPTPLACGPDMSPISGCSAVLLAASDAGTAMLIMSGPAASGSSTPTAWSAALP